MNSKIFINRRSCLFTNRIFAIQRRNSDSPYSIIISNVDFGIDKIFSNYKIIKDQKSISNKSNELIIINDNIDKNQWNVDNENKKMNEESSLLDDKMAFNDSFDSTNTNLTNDYQNQSEENKNINLFLLKDINIKILKGEHTGIIGELVNGKACLLNSFIYNLKAFPKNDCIKGNIKLSRNICFVVQIHGY